MVQRMFTLKAALPYLPFPTVNALRIWLSRHAADFPPYYRARVRFLMEAEIGRIQVACRDTVKRN